MKTLQDEISEKGFTVAHIKTDSIKIPDATPEIIKFVMEFGKRYGYNFEHEATYDKMCLVNDSTYIAKYSDNESINGKKAGRWTATAAQFQVPYVFKTLFSKESIEFDDLCETKSVTTALYLDLNENLPDVSEYENEYGKLMKDINNPDLPQDEAMEEKCERAEELSPKVDEGHNYIFIGQVGRFCPIKPGCGGGLLMREKEGRYSAVTGTKGYRWLEAELVKEMGREKDIDRSYYDRLVDDAVETISKHVDFEWFASEEPYEGSPLQALNEPPF